MFIAIWGSENCTILLNLKFLLLIYTDYEFNIVQYKSNYFHTKQKERYIHAISKKSFATD